MTSTESCGRSVSPKTKMLLSIFDVYETCRKCGAFQFTRRGCELGIATPRGLSSPRGALSEPVAHYRRRIEGDCTAGQPDRSRPCATKVTCRGIGGLGVLPKLDRLALDGVCITPQSVQRLSAFPSLRELWIGDPGADDQTLKLLAELPQLKTLQLRRTSVSDDGLMQAAKMDGLEKLLVWYTPVTYAGLVRFMRTRPEVELKYQRVPDAPEERAAVAALLQIKGVELEADENGHAMRIWADAGYRGVEPIEFDDDDCRLLARLKRLEYVHLRNTHLTGAGLAHLKGLQNLQVLDLRGTAITDADLVHLKSLESLHEIWLANTSVTDAGLGQLQGCSELDTIYLEKACVTGQGVAKLRQSLPGCRIEWP